MSLDVIYRKMISGIFSSVGLNNPFLDPVSMSDTVPSIWMTVYVYVFMTALIMLSVRKFSRKDIT